MINNINILYIRTYVATVYNQLQYNKVCKCIHSWLLLWLDNSNRVEVDPGNLKGKFESGDTCIMYSSYRCHMETV